MEGTGPVDANQAKGRRLGRRAAISLIAGLVVVGAAASLVVRLTTADDAPTIVRRDDPVADLLGWLPANDETRRAFGFWVGEGPVGATPPAVMDVGLQEALGVSPSPRTLGATPGWRQAFGWGAGDVSAWAVAGEGAAILVGEFDLGAVRDALTAAGYRSTTHRGVPLYVLHPVATPTPAIDGSAVSAANAVAILDGRLITAAREGDVRAAIDAAFGLTPSLADDPAVGALLRTAGPNAGLAALDAADLAAVCFTDDPTARATTGAPSGRYVAMAYGRTATDGRRQTTILVTFGDGGAVQAQEAVAAWEYGWVDATVALGGVSAPASAYAALAAAGGTVDTLVARFLAGRAEGWAPIALRLASPVCVAVADLAPPAPAPLATPEATPESESAEPTPA